MSKGGRGPNAFSAILSPTERVSCHSQANQAMASHTSEECSWHHQPWSRVNVLWPLNLLSKPPPSIQREKRDSQVMVLDSGIDEPGLNPQGAGSMSFRLPSLRALQTKGILSSALAPEWQGFPISTRLCPPGMHGCPPRFRPLVRAHDSLRKDITDSSGQ